MNRSLTIAGAAIALAGGSMACAELHAEEWLDRLDDALTVSAWNNQVRTRLSGLVDLEAYHFEGEPPGLIDTSRVNFAAPRLTLLLDSQVGSHVYVFAQARLDRGFDPGDFGTRFRLTEYAVRLNPEIDGPLTLQLGKAATVIGNWVPRHLSWENPFITAPLPYENVTAIYDREAPLSKDDFLHGPAERKYEYIPAIWGPVYATGGSVAYRAGDFDLAAEIKNAALSSRPSVWDLTRSGLDQPTFSGRIGYRPGVSWNLGLSASTGAYMTPESIPTLPAGPRYGDYRQTLIGQDVGFAWHHWQLWAEAYEVRFEVPRVGNADLLVWYAEAKYKFSTCWFAAVRWNQEQFATVDDGAGGREQWGSNLWRTEFALGFRPSAHTQIKLQYSVQRTYSGPAESSQTLAAQFTLRF